MSLPASMEASDPSENVSAGLRVEPFVPAPALRPWVEALWLLEAPASALGVDGVARLEVFPTTAVVLLLHYDNAMTVPAGSSSATRSGLTGLSLAPRVFRPRWGLRSVAVRVRPGAERALLGISGHELAGLHVPAEDALPPREVASLEDELATATDGAARVGVVERWLLRRLRTERTDRLVCRIAQLVVREAGARPVRELAALASLSERQLERRLAGATGLSPKQLARVARFERALVLGASGSWTRAAIDAGYSDQSHLIREFRTFTGTTPGRFQRLPKGDFQRSIEQAALVSDSSNPTRHR